MSYSAAQTAQTPTGDGSESENRWGYISMQETGSIEAIVEMVCFCLFSDYM